MRQGSVLDYLKYILYLNNLYKRRSQLQSVSAKFPKRAEYTLHLLLLAINALPSTRWTFNYCKIEFCVFI